MDSFAAELSKFRFRNNSWIIWFIDFLSDQIKFKCFHKSLRLAECTQAKDRAILYHLSASVPKNALRRLCTTREFFSTFSSLNANQLYWEEPKPPPPTAERLRGEHDGASTGGNASKDDQQMKTWCAKQKQFRYQLRFPPAITVHFSWIFFPRNWNGFITA